MICIKKNNAYGLQPVNLFPMTTVFQLTEKQQYQLFPIDTFKEYFLNPVASTY